MHRALPVALLVAAVALAGCSAKQATGTTSAATPAPSSQPFSSTSTTAAAATSSSSSSPPPPAAPRPARTIEIDIKGIAFVNGTQTIQKGDTVHWVHMDGTTPHSVVSDDGKTFSSDTGGLPCPGPGCMTSSVHSTFDFTFNAVGSFPYHCEVHSSMRNTITVVAALPG